MSGLGLQFEFAAENPESYAYSSFCYMKRPKRRPGFLDMMSSLEQAGGLSEAPDGWESLRTVSRLAVPIWEMLADDD